MLKLFCFPTTISIASAIALYEAGLDHEQVRVDFAKAEQTGPDYHKINPKGRVPALATDHGILTETGAILEYIAACAPQAGLVPADPVQAARMREAMYYLASTMHVNHAHKMRGHRWAREESSHKDMTAKVTENMQDSCDYVENHILQGRFVLGETVSLADPYLFAVASWLEGDGVDVSNYPRLSGFVAAMEERASVKAIRADGLM